MENNERKNKIEKVVESVIENNKEAFEELADIEEMEKALGLDKVQPIVLTESDTKVKEEEGDYFEEMYIEGLREMYLKKNKEKIINKILSENHESFKKLAE